MAKLFSQLCVLITVISISGCVQQLPYSLRADFLNACDYPVQVTASRYSNLDSLNNSRTVGLVEPKQTLNWVLAMTDDTCEVQNAVSDNYKLEISANDKTISLDKAGFLKILKNAKLDHSAFTRIYRWTISDPKLCP